MSAVTAYSPLGTVSAAGPPSVLSVTVSGAVAKPIRRTAARAGRGRRGAEALQEQRPAAGRGRGRNRYARWHR